jgi:hypothetical protein
VSLLKLRSLLSAFATATTGDILVASQKLKNKSQTCLEDRHCYHFSPDVHVHVVADKIAARSLEPRQASQPGKNAL